MYTGSETSRIVTNFLILTEGFVIFVDQKFKTFNFWMCNDIEIINLNPNINAKYIDVLQRLELTIHKEKQINMNFRL